MLMARKIIAREGVGGFYRGFLPNALKNLPNKGKPPVSFPLYHRSECKSIPQDMFEHRGRHCLQGIREHCSRRKRMLPCSLHTREWSSAAEPALLQKVACASYIRAQADLILQAGYLPADIHGSKLGM
jgi:hypothetical protein